MNDIGLITTITFTMTTIVWVLIFQTLSDHYGTQPSYDKY